MSTWRMAGDEPLTGQSSHPGPVSGTIYHSAVRPTDRRISALPSGRARALAFAAILVAGISGALIGSSLVSVQCTGSCGTATGLGAIVGAVAAGGGVAVVAVLVLRAMSEWRQISEEELEGRTESDEPAAG
jgi:hypothetical protein